MSSEALYWLLDMFWLIRKLLDEKLGYKIEEDPELGLDDAKMEELRILYDKSS